MNFFTLPTLIGSAEFVNAKAAGLDVPFTHMAVGDGNGADVTPRESMTALVNERHRVPISSITPHATYPTWMVVEAVLPSSVGGWEVRENAIIGGLGAGGKMLIVGNCPTSYKPLLAEGAVRDMVIRMIVQVTGNASVQLILDPSVAVATSQTVANAIALHEAKADPHPQYAKGAALTGHIQAADPHPQYSKASDLAAHLLAADPHPQYVTAAELAAQLASALATLSDPARAYFISQS